MGRNGVFIITTNKSKKPSSIVLEGTLVIENGEIRGPDENLVGRSGSFDKSNVKNVTVRMTQEEKENGVTWSSKLLKEYPDLFHVTPEGGVTTREPASVKILNEK